MKPASVALALLFFLLPLAATAHVGSPDVFYEGPAGPYPVSVTIRMPAVVPGRAQILVQMKSGDPVQVSFLPIFARTAVRNAPPADAGQPVPGEPNLYTGDLWLMTFGAYSIEIQIHGKAGEGTIQIPVNSEATSQLPLPPYLQRILILLGAMLIIGGLSIVEAATREGTLQAGAIPGPSDRRKGLVSSGIAALIVTLLLIGGGIWWQADAAAFRRHLLSGGWPDLNETIQVQGSQRIMHLTIGENDLAPDRPVQLLLDHGKLLHLFLVRQPSLDVMAHIHPIRTGGKTFDVALPPIPGGRYEAFCDMTFQQGLSTTGTMSLDIPPIPAPAPGPVSLPEDPDDSWANGPAVQVTAGDTISRLPNGLQVIWKAHAPLRVKQDAAMHFEVRDSAGKPVDLQPYMGMISHVALLRADCAVFAHLHPTGNYSMAAQMYFQKKMADETSSSTPAANDMSNMPGMVMDIPPGEGSSISIPYQFPSAGNYRIWVQFKAANQILTAIFDTTVSA